MKSRNITLIMLVCFFIILMTACGENFSDEIDELISEIKTQEAEIAGLSTQIAELEETQVNIAPRIESNGEVISYLATRMPIGELPVPGIPYVHSLCTTTLGRGICGL